MLAVAVFSAFLSACGDNNQDTSKNTVIKIQDELVKSGPLKCTYTDEEGVKTIMYFKGNNIRVDSVKNQPEDPSASEVIKDNKVYIWSDGSDNGMMMDFSRIAEGNEYFRMGETPIRSAKDIMNKVSQGTHECQPQDISDSMFEVPQNIKFPDSVK